jgi:DNA-binding response OmpR family regulator
VSLRGAKEARFVSSKGCIAIIEPDDLIRQLLERWLGEAGYRILDPANDHEKGKVVPHLVIADVPDPSCAAGTMELLRAAYSVPILALSTRFRRGLGGSMEAAHRLDASGVLPKPFTREELLAAVARAIEYN